MEEKALVGMTREESRTVTEDQLACRVGSGTARVFATPCLAALMEAVCMHLVQPCLEEGIGTVGTALDIVHTAATPLGMTVTVEAVLLETDGRGLPFTSPPGTRPAPWGRVRTSAAPSKPPASRKKPPPAAPSGNKREAKQEARAFPPRGNARAFFRCCLRRQAPSPA